MIARDESMEKAKYLLSNFDRALKEEWIEVYYQPIIRAASGRVCNEEALVRWDDPIIGVLNPGDFIAILEAVNVVHKLDLYVLEHVLVKMKEQQKQGIFVVPTSINLSQIDFYSCDIVDELVARVDDAGIPRSKIALEVTETATARNNENVLEQLVKLKELGFKVWMDDYGSGDSSPMLFQKIHFDLLKINISLVNQVKYNETAKVIITELIRMAIALGMETAAEGVETEEQAEFLKEIGCAKLQGFYYCRPIPKEVVFDRYKKGAQIGFENPAEADYYSAVGNVNLYDLSVAKKEPDEDNPMSGYFDTWPMAIVESDGEDFTVVRGNKTFREFVETNFPHKADEINYKFTSNVEGVGSYTVAAMKQCCMDGKMIVIDDRTADGKAVQMLIQRIAVNEVTHVTALAFVILSITDSQHAAADNLTYNYIARVLSEDYIDLFFVDLDTGKFVEYAPDGNNRDISVERHGDNFFEQVKKDAIENVHKEDQHMFLESFDKDFIEKNLKEHGVFSLTYRLYIDMVPTYVNLKAVKTRTKGNQIIIGVSNVDAQVRRQEALERVKEEQITFSRIAALSGDFISIYTVDPNTDRYEIYKTTSRFQALNLESSGENFFEEAVEEIKSCIYPEDLEGFLKVFSKNQVMDKIKENGLFVYNYRLCFDGVPSYVTLKIAKVEEMDGPQLIVGLIDIDEQVRKELEYSINLAIAEDKAYKDELTGVKNKHSYADFEDMLNDKIRKEGEAEFAIVILDLNGLKQVNDNLGHQSGDLFIQQGCSIICNIFSHSPVYRVGGDEFVVVAQGGDYNNLDKLLAELSEVNKNNHENHEVTMAFGEAKFQDKDRFVSDVFERADSKMYKKKKEMKRHGYGRFTD